MIDYLAFGTWITPLSYYAIGTPHSGTIWRWYCTSSSSMAVEFLTESSRSLRGFGRKSGRSGLDQVGVSALTMCLCGSCGGGVKARDPRGQQTPKGPAINASDIWQHHCAVSRIDIGGKRIRQVLPVIEEVQHAQRSPVSILSYTAATRCIVTLCSLIRPYALPHSCLPSHTAASSVTLLRNVAVFNYLDLLLQTTASSADRPGVCIASLAF